MFEQHKTHPLPRVPAPETHTLFAKLKSTGQLHFNHSQSTSTLPRFTATHLRCTILDPGRDTFSEYWNYERFYACEESRGRDYRCRFGSSYRCRSNKLVYVHFFGLQYSTSSLFDICILQVKHYQLSAGSEHLLTMLPHQPQSKMPPLKSHST
jgi:hypothetical protein